MQLNRITAFKKAAGRLTACCLFILVAAFSFVSVADAAQVLKKTSDLITGPEIANNRVVFKLGGNVKHIQHAKYLSHTMKSPDDIGVTTARTRITGFAYTCPGYYTTRIYSDLKGTQLIGYIQVYVSEGDVKNSKCDAITVPSGTPAPTEAQPSPPVSVTPTAPKGTHPVPEVEKVEIKTKPTATKPKVPAEVVAAPTQTFNDYCWNHGQPKKFKYQKIPGMVNVPDGDECCPVSLVDPTNAGTTYKVLPFNGDWESYTIAYGPSSTDWICGAYYGDVSKTYCPSSLAYNSATKTCDEQTEEVIGNLGSWPANASDYTAEVDDESIFGVLSEEKPRRWWQPLRAYAARRE